MSDRLARWLPLGTLLSAACALSLEIAVVRLGAPRVGQSLLPWTGAIVSVLLGLAIGHLLGGAAGGHGAPVLALRRWLARGWTAAAAAAALLPLAVARLVDMAWWMSASTDTAALAVTALAFPASLFAGMALPLALRLTLAQAAADSSWRVAAVLAASALGSVAGTAATGFWLLETVGAAGVALGTAAVWTGMAILVLPAAQAPIRRLMAVMPALACLALAGAAQRPWPPCDAETRYTCIRLIDEPLANGGLLRFMVLDEGVHSASDRDHPRRLHLGYAALVDQLTRPVLEHRGSPRALVIGGGGATLPRAWAHTYPGIQVTVAEIDATVARTAARALWADQPALHTRVGDGRAVLRALPSTERQDVILLDAYRTRSVPPHLVSIEFARLVHARLSEGGLYLSNVIDGAGTMQLTTAVAATLSAVFDRVEIWVPELGSASSTNAVVAAWRGTATTLPAGDVTVKTTVLAFGSQARDQDVRWQRLDLAGLHARWHTRCVPILTDDRAPVDRLLAGHHPCPPRERVIVSLPGQRLQWFSLACVARYCTPARAAGVHRPDLPSPLRKNDMSETLELEYAEAPSTESERPAARLPFVLAGARPYALEQYEPGELGYYDPITQMWRGNVQFHKSTTSRNVTSTSGRTSDSDMQSDVLGN